MGYTTPVTRATGYLATAANWNELVNDLIDLDARTNPVTARVDTSQTTTSTSFVDLATVGPQVTLTTGTQALVIITARMLNSASPAGQNDVGVAVSGATTKAATSIDSLIYNQFAAASNYTRMSCAVLLTGLTAGSNTFTLKYAVTSGTGTFIERTIIVWPGNKLA